MASNINLSRNTRVYFTTNLSGAGVVLDAIGSATNTWEIQVLDGYSFTQTNQQANVMVTEAGATPSRGGRTFNTQLSPADWSFSTYIRPYIDTSIVKPTERVLWNALLGAASMDETGYAVTGMPTRTVTTGAGASIATAVITTSTANVSAGQAICFHGATNFADWNQPAVIQAGGITGNATTSTVVCEFAKAPAASSGLAAVGTTKAFVGQWVPSISNTTASQNFAYASTMGSNKQQLQKFGLIFVVDTVVYALDNCAMDQASVDFGLDAISTIAWTGKATALRKLSTLTNANIVATAVQPTTANYITNKLSTMTLESNIGGSANTGGGTTVQYSIPVTGGNLTIANNLNYLTPNNLGVLNQPIAYFTGERKISGTVTAYLRTGSALSGSGADAGALLANMLGATGSTAIEPKYRMQVELGGAANATRLEFDMSGVNLTLPAVNVADVVAATITFNAQAFTPDVNGASVPAFDLTRTNELVVRYYSA